MPLPATTPHAAWINKNIWFNSYIVSHPEGKKRLTVKMILGFEVKTGIFAHIKCVLLINHIAFTVQIEEWVRL